MPAVHFVVEWPDGDKVQYYSPSTIVHQYFDVEKPYSIEQFDDLCTRALTEASERVRAKFGYACTAAAGELEKIKHKVHVLKSEANKGRVRVTFAEETV